MKQSYDYLQRTTNGRTKQPVQPFTIRPPPGSNLRNKREKQHRHRSERKVTMLVNNNSFNSALLMFVLFIFIAGCLVSAALSGTDIVNFLRNGAEADRMRAETEWQQELRELDLPYIESEREAYSQELIAQSQRDTQLLLAEGEREEKVIAARAEADALIIVEQARLDIAQSEQKLEMQKRWSYLLTNIVLIVGIAVVLVFIYFGIRLIYLWTSRYPTKQPQRRMAKQTYNDPWKDESFRKSQRCKARLVEQKLRQVEIDETADTPFPFPELIVYQSTRAERIDVLRK